MKQKILIAIAVLAIIALAAVVITLNLKADILHDKRNDMHENGSVKVK